VIVEGVYIVASVNIPATLLLRSSLRCDAWPTCYGVERRRGDKRLSRATSFESLESVLLLKMTLVRAALYSNVFIVIA
jgi:hypothetical protein